MAKISLSPLVVDIRNKIGDTVFSKWKGVNYARSRVVPSNPKSAGQTEVRNALKAMVEIWQDLLGVHKLSWESFASGRNLSGFNAFVGINTPKQRAATLLTFMKPGTETSLSAFSCAAGTLTKEIDVTFVATPVPADKTLHVIARKVTAGLGESVLEKFEIAALAASPQTIEMSAAAQDYEFYGFIADGSLAVATAWSYDMSDTGTSQT